jgi:hypothetical protein
MFGKGCFGGKDPGADITKPFSPVHPHFMLVPIAAVLKELIRFWTVFESANIRFQVLEHVFPSRISSGTSRDNP